jgi:hypothetical protein
LSAGIKGDLHIRIHIFDKDIVDYAVPLFDWRKLLAEEGWRTVYQTDFSEDPDWTTTDPTNIYWNSSAETYHVWQSDVICSYAYKQVNNVPGRSLRLSYDIKVNSIIPNPIWEYPKVVFGLFGYEMMSFGVQDASHIQGELNYNPEDLVNSQYWAVEAGGVNLGQWHSSDPGLCQAGNWYNIQVEYSSTTTQASMTVRRRSDNSLVWFVVMPPADYQFSQYMQFLGVATPFYCIRGPGVVGAPSTIDHDLDNILLKEQVK